MSGGHFNYDQYKIEQMREDVLQLIENESSDALTEWGAPVKRGYSPATIAEFKAAGDLLKKAFVYVQRIDRLESGDDGEESFHRRLREDLKELE